MPSSTGVNSAGGPPVIAIAWFNLGSHLTQLSIQSSTGQQGGHHRHPRFSEPCWSFWRTESTFDVLVTMVTPWDC